MVPPRALLVDDDQELRRLLAGLLRHDGMLVREAGTGADALDMLGDSEFDLVVTDVVMPPPGGMQLAAMVRTAGAAVPMLVITGMRDPRVAHAVSQLQHADLLLKPFSTDEFLDRVHGLLERTSAPSLPPSHNYAAPVSDQQQIFPPALVPILRSRLSAIETSISGLPDEVLVDLLSIVFFAGLESEEGVRNPVRVVFAGCSLPNNCEDPHYRWSSLCLRAPRPLSVQELVKLAAATSSERLYAQVRYYEGRAWITGLAREAVNLEDDAVIKLVVQRPGGLSIRMGRIHIIDYEHGRVQGGSGEIVLSAGPVRRALESAAQVSGVPAMFVPTYLNAIRALLANLSSHGFGGIVVITPEESPDSPRHPGYFMLPNDGLAPLLRRLDALGKASGLGDPRQSIPAETVVAIDQFVRGTFVNEIEKTIEDYGGLTALDGATILSRSLALIGFGVILPVDENCKVAEAVDVDGHQLRPFDLGTRGTRHRAGATFANDHPGSAVFVASQDGDLCCLFRGIGAPFPILWRFRPEDLRAHRTS